MIYFTSDTHFGHTNVIRFCDRPFSSAEEMDEVLIENWNLQVTNSDTIYFLGDFCFSRKQEDIQKIFNRLNGCKILIKGNHDHKNVYKKVNWHQVHEQVGVHYENTYIWLNHYPQCSWNRSCHGSWHLHGHVHNRGDFFHNALSCDIGVDFWNYKPVSFTQIKEWFEILKEYQQKGAFLWKGVPFKHCDVVYFSEIEKLRGECRYENQ